jgi:hypothetical protein
MTTIAIALTCCLLVADGADPPLTEAHLAELFAQAPQSS